MAKKEVSKEETSSQDRLLRAVETLVLIVVGQLSIGLLAAALFFTSFLSSPLRPLVWAQLAAVVVLIFGGLVLVVLVVGRYRGEILSILRRVLRR